MILVIEMRMVESLGCKCLTKYSIAPKWLNLRSRLLTLFQCQMSEKLKPRTITLETYSPYCNFTFFMSLSVVSNICRYTGDQSLVLHPSVPYLNIYYLKSLRQLRNRTSPHGPVFPVLFLGNTLETS